jgi:hypothetical protein
MTGALTCDVQGSATGGVYVATTGEIFQRVLTERAGLTTADIDTAAVAALVTDAPGDVGLYLTGDTTILEALDTLLTGAGGFYTVGRDGRFSAALFKAPGVSLLQEVTLDDDDLDLGGMELSRRILPYTKVRLGYDRNFSPNANVSANVTDENDRARLKDEFRVTSAATSGAANFLLAKESDLMPTQYVWPYHGNAEAVRRATLFGQLRFVWVIQTTLVGTRLALGGLVGLALGRVMSGATVLARVVGLRESIMSDKVEVEVWL